MDEIQYKLNTNNSVLVVNAIEKLINTVKTKYKPAERQKFVLENEELRFLRDKCSAKETVVSLTACQGLLALVESGVLEIGHTMSTVITLLPTAHNYSAIISTMAGLLMLDLKSRLVPGRPYVCQFSLGTPQHPFITVMERSADTLDDVLTQMHAICNHPDYTVSSNSLQLLSTVFFWLTCHPQRASSQRAWQLLLSLHQHSAQPELLLNCLSWMQTSNPKLTESCFAAYAAVTEIALYQRQQEYATAILPVLAVLSNQMIANGRDPRACYSLMERCLATDAPELRWGAGLTLSLLADNLSGSCAAHLHELFNLCLNIIMKYDYSSLPLNMFVGLSLQWIHLPSSLTINALKVAAKILEAYRNNTKDDPRLNMPNLASNKIFQSLMHTDLRLVTNFTLFKTWERVRDNPDKLRSWFDTLEKVDGVVQLDLVSFLIGIVMENNSQLEDISMRALKILLRLVDVKKDLTVTLLPILLYKIANEKSPSTKLECLRALPLMAKTKENVPTIVAVLNKLRSSKSLPHSLLISLYCSLVEVQVRCFPYLQEVLETTVRHDDVKWEVELARARAVLRICEVRPTQGLELVSVISSILNRCTSASGSLCAAAAVAALRALWRARLLAPAGTWHTLQPKLAADTRLEVQLSVCLLLSEIPELRVSTPEYAQLAASACRALWRLAAEGVPRVVVAACGALARFELTDYSLRDVPEMYRETVKLPALYCKTPEDAARNPVDVLDYIPCEIWPQVFKYTNQASLSGVRQLCTILITREVRGYRSGVYQCEHPDAALTTLPQYSVVKGLASALRKQATSPSYDWPDAVLLEILHTLAAEYPRPLPPMNLAFLHDLFHRGEHWRQPCLLLAARQASTEVEARRFLDNYLVTVDPGTMQEEEILTVFTLLPQLCRNMPPNSIRGPLEKCLTDAFSKISHVKAKDYKEDAAQEILFLKQLEWTRVSLENEKIHDANRALLSQFVENYFQVIGEDSVAWPDYVATCTALSTTYLERMTSPSSWWESSSRQLRASCDVRCALATNVRAAVWLNEVVDAAAAMPAEHEYTLRRMTPVLQSLKDDAGTREWLMQLLARTQREFAESHSPVCARYLWSVFTLGVVLVSGRWSFEPDNTTADFPAAVAALFSRDEWTTLCPRVLECLVYARQVITDGDASLACHRALLCASKRDNLPIALWRKAVHYTQLIDDL